MTIRSDMRDYVSHLGHGTTTGQSTLTEKPLTRYFDFVKEPDAAAGDTLTTFFVRFPVAVKLVSIHLTPGAAMTANDTNYATLTCTSEDGAGGGSAAVFTCTTKKAAASGTGDWVAGDTLDASSTLFSTAFSEKELAAGSVLKLVQAKAAAGVALSYSLTVEFQLNG